MRSANESSIKELVSIEVNGERVNGQKNRNLRFVVLTESGCTGIATAIGMLSNGHKMNK